MGLEGDKFVFSNLGDPSFILRIFLVLFSLVIHEFAHAAAATLLGDKTAKHAGRLTLNPLAHLELLGLIMILFAPIGWARPVPVNPRNFNQPRLGWFLTSAAGPLSNLLLACIGFGVLRANLVSPIGGAWYAIHALIVVNISLMVFNLIPLPPLDGSQMLRSLLPVRQAILYSRLDVYGPFILLMIFVIPQLGNAVFGRLFGLAVTFVASWFGMNFF